ncbi:hypothetical protein X742_12145 [Mesorhizobium sp. LNHC232B00]|nr:hypothetical protein X742_12145 [Mesorhizobium sp. LNHC232B00]
MFQIPVDWRSLRAFMGAAETETTSAAAITAL